MDTEAQVKDDSEPGSQPTTNTTSETTTPEPASATTEKWLRLSPLSVIFFLGRFVKHLLSDALPALAPMGIVLINSDNKINSLIMLVAAVAAISVINSFLQYWFFKFRLKPEEFIIHQGVFKKQHRVINFDRIQNINIQQPIYYRPFKLVALSIETAGSKGDEGNLAGIPLSLAHALRDQVHLYQIEHKDDRKTNVDNDQTNLNDMVSRKLAFASTADLVRYGLSSSGILWLFAFTAPFFKVITENFPEVISKNVMQVSVNLFGDGVIANIAVIIFSVFSLLFLLALFSVSGAIIRFHKYQLSIKDTTLKRSSGLINTHEESVNLSKIQAVVRHYNFIGGWFKRENLICRQIKTGNVKQQGRAHLFMVPAQTVTETNCLIKSIFNDAPENIQTRHIDRRYILKTWLVRLILPFFILLIIPASTINVAFLLVMLIPILCYPLVVRRWARFGYGMKQGYGLIKSGFIGNRQTLFPLFKAQRVVISQSPVQKSRNLATLNIFLSSNLLTIPYMPLADAQLWFDRIYYHIETDKRAWF